MATDATNGTDEAAQYARLQNEMRKWFQDQGIHHFFLDGPLTGEYWAAPFKIAVLNLEAYGYQDCGVTDITLSQVATWMKATGGEVRTKTTRYTSVFVHCLRLALASHRVITAEDLKACYPCLDVWSNPCGQSHTSTYARHLIPRHSRMSRHW